jgi:hypothetical protein
MHISRRHYQTHTTEMQVRAEKERWGPDTKKKHTHTQRTTVYKYCQSAVSEVGHFASVIIIHTKNYIF